MNTATAPAGLYDSGRRWIHRTYPITKLAAVVLVATLAFTLPLRYAAGVLAVIVLTLFASGVVRPVIRATMLLMTIGIALFLLHGVLSPDKGAVLVDLGPIKIGGDGLVFAATILVRLAVFAISINAVMSTTHPKVLAVALIERGVSHKIAYAYLAGVELLPEMRSRARDILDAQQSRGFDTKGSITRRIKGLSLLLKPLLLGAVISADTRSLALESRGFSIRGGRTSTAPVPRLAGARLVWAGLLCAAAAILAGRIIWWLIP